MDLSRFQRGRSAGLFPVRIKSRLYIIDHQSWEINVFLSEKGCAPVYSVIALSRQAFCSYTFFIFSQRKDGENVAECYKTIEYPDRKAIAALYAAGAKAGQIAKEIGVAPRTIYAELKRGREGDKLDKNFRPSYDADLAQKRAQESLRRRGRRKGGPAE